MFKDESREQESNITEENIQRAKKRLGFTDFWLLQWIASYFSMNTALKQLKRDELVSVAGRLGITGRTSMNKDQLKEAITEYNRIRIRIAVIHSQWKKPINIIVFFIGLLGAMASIMGLMLDISSAGNGGNGGDRIPPKDPVTKYEVLIHSKALPVNVTIDKHLDFKLNESQDSKTFSLTEGKHFIVATKGDMSWEEWFVVSGTWICIIPEEKHFNKQ